MYTIQVTDIYMDSLDSMWDPDYAVVVTTLCLKEQLADTEPMPCSTAVTSPVCPNCAVTCYLNLCSSVLAFFN